MDVGYHGKATALTSFVAFCVFVHVATLPAYRFFCKTDTRLGLDGYLPWLLAVVHVCYNCWECVATCT